MHRGDIIKIIYIDRTNAISQRTVLITEIRGRVMKAYCYYRRQRRVFHIDNILGWQLIRHCHAAS